MTTVNLQELIRQHSALAAQIEAARKDQRGEAISQVRAIVHEHELTVDDVFGKAKKASAPKAPKTPGAAAPAKSATGGTAEGSKVPAKYHNPETGQKWAGRGKTPNWMKGQDKQAFLIPQNLK